jgi:hypothetical protein
VREPVPITDDSSDTKGFQPAFDPMIAILPSGIDLINMQIIEATKATVLDNG